MQPPTLYEIERWTLVQYATTPEQLRGKGRHPATVAARRTLVALARELTAYSYPEIAHHLGRVNHTSVKTQHDDFLRELPRDDELRRRYRAIRDRLTGTGENQ